MLIRPSGKTFKTISESLEPWQKKTLSGYFDTFGLRRGNHSIKIELNYQNSKETEAGIIEIIEAPVPEIEKPSFISLVTNTKTILVIIAVLRIANITWMLIWTRRKNKK